MKATEAKLLDFLRKSPQSTIITQDNLNLLKDPSNAFFERQMGNGGDI
ncbi:MAG: hypothetical protein ACYDEF_03505 [Methanosarcina sp.]